MTNHTVTSEDAVCDGGTDIVLNVLLPLLVLCLMLGIGAALTARDMKRALRSKKAIVTGWISQFGVMPLLAFTMTRLFDLSMDISVGVLIIGACPGGTTSNLFSLWGNGDCAISVTMTVLSTLCASFMLPLLMMAYIGALGSGHEVKVSYTNLVASLFLLVLPVAIGMYIRHKSFVWGKRVATFGSLAGFSFIAIAIVYGSITQSHLFFADWSIWVIAFTMTFVGFVFGYLVARLAGLEPRARRTVGLETGIQNSALGLAIVQVSFSVNGCVTADLILFPLLYSLWVVLDGAIIALLLSTVPTMVPPKADVIASQVATTKDPVSGETIYRSRLSPVGEPLTTIVPGDHAATLWENFQAGARTFPRSRCLGAVNAATGKYEWLTYEQVSKHAADFGSGLVSMGLAAGDAVAIYGKNCPQWVVAEQGAASQGLVVVPLYDTLGDGAVEHICEAMDVQVIVCELGAAATTSAAMLAKGKVKHVVIMDGTFQAAAHSNAGSSTTSFATVLARGTDCPLPAHMSAPGDLATVCFTSGTTGTPKGVKLTHGNMIACMAGGHQLLSSGIAGHAIALDDQDVYLSFLPLAHMFERTVQIMLLRSGSAIGFYRGDVRKLKADIAALRPTVMAVVPRLLTRMHSAILNRVNSSGCIKRKLFHKAFAQKAKLLEERGINEHGFWDGLVFSKIQAQLGGRLRLMITGSAPIAPDVLKFFRIAFSCIVLEGYGQTETAAASHLTLPGDVTSGHVGVPLPCTEVKLVSVPDMGYTTDGPGAIEGEVCFRGPNITSGYYHDDARTAEAIQDGWLHSGDIGRINANGTLTLIDRRKNLFKLAQGEYISPGKVENALAQHPAVEQVWVHGDSLQSYLVAIVVPSETFVEWLDRAKSTIGASGGSEGESRSTAPLKARVSAGGPEGARIARACQSAAVVSRLLEELQARGAAAGLSSLERVKRLAVSTTPFSVENGFLTPTFKLKRQALRKAYRPTLDALYAQTEAQALSEVVAIQLAPAEADSEGGAMALAAAAGSGAGAGAGAGVGAQGASATGGDATAAADVAVELGDSIEDVAQQDLSDDDSVHANPTAEGTL